MRPDIPIANPLREIQDPALAPDPIHIQLLEHDLQPFPPPRYFLFPTNLPPRKPQVMSVV